MNSKAIQIALIATQCTSTLQALQESLFLQSPISSGLYLSRVLRLFFLWWPPRIQWPVWCRVAGTVCCWPFPVAGLLLGVSCSTPWIPFFFNSTVLLSSICCTMFDNSYFDFTAVLVGWSRALIHPRCPTWNGTFRSGAVLLSPVPHPTSNDINH